MKNLLMQNDISMEDFKKTISKFEQDSVNWVDVTHIINPSNFYVRFCDHMNILWKIMPREQLKHPDSINIGDLVFYENKKREKNLMRGLIKEITKLENSCTIYSIFAIDFGFYDREITVNNIWQCKLRLPPLAHLCELYQCVPNTKDFKWSKQSIEAMVTFVGPTKVQLIMKGKSPQGKYSVQIYNHPSDVATMLILANCAWLDYAPPTVSKFTSKTLQQS